MYQSNQTPSKDHEQKNWPFLLSERSFSHESQTNLRSKAISKQAQNGSGAQKVDN